MFRGGPFEGEGDARQGGRDRPTDEGGRSRSDGQRPQTGFRESRLLLRLRLRLRNPKAPRQKRPPRSPPLNPALRNRLQRRVARKVRPARRAPDRPAKHRRPPERPHCSPTTHITQHTTIHYTTIHYTALQSTKLCSMLDGHTFFAYNWLSFSLNLCIHHLSVSHSQHTEYRTALVPISAILVQQPPFLHSVTLNYILHQSH